MGLNEVEGVVENSWGEIDGWMRQGKYISVFIPAGIARRISNGSSE